MIHRSLCLVATIPLAFAATSPALAQTDAGSAYAAQPDRQIDFSADAVQYDDKTDVVTVSGHVLLNSEGQTVRADRVIWNRRAGEVRAAGNVIINAPSGEVMYGDNVVLDSALKNGAITNMLLVMADGGRLAAVSGHRNGDITTLDHAAFTPCPVVDSDGCPRTPSWKITAVQIVHDPAGKQLRFKRAKVYLFGLPLATVPVLAQTLGDDGKSGLLMADLQYTRSNGVELAVPYYFDLGPNRDLTVTTHLYTATFPMLEGKYRALTSKGAYQIGGFATYASRLPAGVTTGNATKAFRGYLDASGKFQLDPRWSITASIRRATDRTFLRRYGLPYDDRLRSTVDLEHIVDRSYFSASAWSTQTMRANEDQGQVPIALPVLDYRRRLADRFYGGTVDLQWNALALTRTSGQDTQRMFASMKWERRAVTAMGQELLLTGYARGDLYHSSDNLRTATAIYRGNPGFQARGVVAAAAEARWAFVGKLGNGTQRLTPRVQFVVSPATPNLNVPNEDARAVELEDSNLFALNRFPGYDRWEDGPRLTIGADWAFDAPGISVAATIGQSYRFNSQPTILPPGTGLSDRTSDIVGRTRVKYRRWLSFTHRYRIDKHNFAVRRNEIDANFGTDRTYGTISYVRMNRNIDSSIEDLRDHEEVRLGGRIQLSRYFSAFGATTIDLTNKEEDPTSVSDGYQPIRHQFGIAYTDDCLDIGFTWRRDYSTSGDARSGDSFVLRLAFRGFGR